MLLLVDAKLVTIVVVLRIPRRKKKKLPGVQWTLVDDKSKSRICGERNKEEGSRWFAKLEKAKQYQMQCLVELRRRCSRMVEDEARGRSLFEGSGLERVHRVENWVPNLFKYYFFFPLTVSSLDGRAVRAVFEKVGNVEWVQSGWV